MARAVLRCAVVLAASVASVGCLDGGPPRARILGPAGELRLSVAVEEARTADERRAGLRGRAPLGEDQGLLLAFPTSDVLCVHNVGVTYAIDAVFIDVADRVVALAPGLPPGEPDAACRGPADRVLEVRAGRAARVERGDRLEVEP